MRCFIPQEFFGYFNLFYTSLNLPREMSGGSCHISAIRVFSSKAEAIAHKASIVFELINSVSAVFTQILHSFFAKSLRVPSTRCGLSVTCHVSCVIFFFCFLDKLMGLVG